MHHAYDCGGGAAAAPISLAQRKRRLGFQGVEENSGNGLLGGFCLFPEKMVGIERVVSNLVLTKLGFWKMQRERERERERERKRGADWEFKKFR